MKTIKLIVGVLFFVLLIAGAANYISGHDIAVLSPQGSIASDQKKLMITATALMLVVVLPVFVLTAVIAWRYRESNFKAQYTPDWDHHPVAETIWWGFPCLIIIILSVVTWNSSHQLDPFKPLVSDTKPINIQVIALDWKWLFIYPEQNIATLNYVQFPAGTPVNFQITSDAPMNSFWIPQLGGQIYAMAGMSTQLHLVADKTGSFAGSSANLSGEGFAGMKFTARATSEEDFNSWVESVRQSPNIMSTDAYNKLSLPSKDNPVTYYAYSEADLYDTVVMKFMGPLSLAGHNHGYGDDD